MNVSTAEYTWWQLTDSERQQLEEVIDHIIFTRYHGQRAPVLALISIARERGYDADPLVAAILWILSEKVSEL